jgi:anti-sigma-K factor RskA
MRDADHDQFLDLIPAYALNSLDADDAQAVSRHLAGCEACQAELATNEGVVDVLPLAAAEATPSPALKGRLMDRIQAQPVAEPAAKATELPWWQQAAADFQAWLAGPRWRPALLLAILILAIGNIYFWREATQPSPTAWRRIFLQGTEVAPEATGVIYISADGQNGAIIVDKLLQLDEAQQYQLWLIADGQRTSGAVFSVPADGYQTVLVESPRPLREYGAFGITVEPAGGSPGPTGDRVLGSDP